MSRIWEDFFTVGHGIKMYGFVNFSIGDGWEDGGYRRVGLEHGCMGAWI